MLKNLQKSIKTHHIIVLVGVVILVFALYNYSSNKSLITDAMTGQKHMVSDNTKPSLSNSGNVEPNNDEEQYSSAEGMTTNTNNLGVSNTRQLSDPSELLPKDENSEWAKLNPTSSSDMMNVNLLKAGWMAGINTVGSSLRNPNLQLRSEPANPQTKPSPWNTTTIEPDLMRTPLELGPKQYN